MCLGPELLLPVIIGGALSAGGKMIEQGENNANAKRVAGARNAVLADTLIKNDQIAGDTRNKFNANQTTYTPQNVNIRQQAEEAGRVDNLESVATVPEALPTTADSPDIVKQEVAKRMSEAVANGKKKAKAQAKLGAFGDQWFKAGLGTDQASRDVAVQSGFANQNLALMPHIQDFAEVGAYKPVSPLGGIMMGLGGAVGSAGGSGYFKR